jgi:glycosyltransferase involved in cell wall biosynthesis
MAVVTFVLPGLTDRPSGGYKVVYAYAGYLTRAGHDVVICHAFFPSGRHLAGGDLFRRLFDRYRQERVARRAASTAPDRPSWYPVDPAIQIRNFARLSPASVPHSDVIVATAVHTAPLVSAAAQRQGAKGVYFIQHFETWDAPTAFVEATWRLPLKRVVIAPWLAEKGRELGVETTLVMNAVDPSEFHSGPEIAQRPTSLVALVSSTPWKRTDLVVSVMRSLSARLPGFRGATFGTCPRPAGLPDTVAHFQEPSRDELAQLYADAKVYLCASDAEGWHLPPSEAMLAGAAVVSTDIGGVRAYADETAVFAPVGDADALSEAVLSLLQDPEHCQALASKGQQLIAVRTPADAAREFEQALLGAVSN